MLDIASFRDHAVNIIDTLWDKWYSEDGEEFGILKNRSASWLKA